ncbi:hypothetical protein EU244_027690 [Rhodococcus qingshengii]|nr:hypothetical protein [Rhodococcus qingshengii]
MTYALGTPQAQGRVHRGNLPDARLPIAVSVTMIGMCLFELVHLLIARIV